MGVPPGWCTRAPTSGCESWHELESWITALGENPGGPPYEEYVTEPDPATDPEKLHTVIVWPLA